MFTKISEIDIYYQRTGRGKDLIMLHGWGQDSSSFWRIVDPLKDRFSLWLVDLPGFGRSDNPKRPFKVQDYAKVVEEFIKKNKITNPVILGHSVGGRVAIKLAATNPSLIEKIILEDSAGVIPEGAWWRKLLLPLAKTFHFLMPSGNLKERIRHKVYSSLESDYPDVGELKETFTNILNEDLTPDLPKIQNETLIIWGEKDRAVPIKYGKRMYRLIEKSRLEIIEGVGHFPHLENAERFVYYVKDFI